MTLKSTQPVVLLTVESSPRPRSAGLKEEQNHPSWRTSTEKATSPVQVMPAGARHHDTRGCWPQWGRSESEIKSKAWVPNPLLPTRHRHKSACVSLPPAYRPDEPWLVRLDHASTQPQYRQGHDGLGQQAGRQQDKGDECSRQRPCCPS